MAMSFRYLLARKPLPIVQGSFLSLALISCSAQAVEFHIGELEGSLNSDFSYGQGWALRDADPDLMRSSVINDGKRNFKKGDAFSRVFKGMHELELRYGQAGALVRGKYWYDFELEDNDQRYRNVESTGRVEAAKNTGSELMDAFVWYESDFGGRPGSVRLGRQVLSWGESTFIQGGINVINPFDVAALRRPGSEIKDGLRPVNMLSISQSLTDNLSAEIFYQFEWEQTVIDNCGTFFSTNDVVADGCGPLPVSVSDDPAVQVAAMAALAPEGVQFNDEGLSVQRAEDIKPKDNGQWGAALRYFSPEADTEFGFYYLNYHSRMPFISAISSPHMADLSFAPDICVNLGIPAASCSTFLASEQGQALVQAYRLGTSQYLIEYPEDIHLYGLSFSTSLDSGASLSGEISYRPNMPLQFNPVDLISMGVGVEALSPLLYSGEVNIENSAYVEGYNRKPVTQAQVTAIQFFDDVFSADRLSVVAEAGMTHIADLEGPGGVRYGRSTNYGQGRLYPDNSLCTGYTNNKSPEDCNNKGFATEYAWGYRMRATLEYSQWIAGVSFKPSIAFSHDVNGYGPEPGFSEGNKAVTAGLDMEYMNTYRMSVSYTDYFDGDYNLNTDRDFVSASVGVSF